MSVSKVSSIENPMSDIIVPSPPDDTITALRFNPQKPGVTAPTYLLASSWDFSVRCWEIQSTGESIPKAQQSLSAPIMDACWNDDGTKVFLASADKQAKAWDLGSNQVVQVAQHSGVVKTCHWIQAPNYQCLMTGSWDKTLKFWDVRSANPMMTLQLPERCYCADAVYPLAVVCTANRGIVVYSLENQPSQYKLLDSPLKFQHRCLSIFKDKLKQQPVGFALGSIEGRCAIQYVNPVQPKDNFTFKCHRDTTANTNVQDVYAVNDIAFHPVHYTLATVGGDRRFSFWDKDARTKLKGSELFDQQITCAAFDPKGQIFAYASGYDWSKGHEFNNQQKKPVIFLRSGEEDMKPRNLKKL